MGEAFTSLANDASAVYWNPAGLGLLDHREVMLMHNEWLVSTRYEYLAGVLSMPFGGFAGASLTYLDYGSIEGRNEVGSRSANYSAYDAAFSLSYARKVREDLTAGMTLKAIQSKIETQKATAFAEDMGLLYKAPICGLQAGLMVQNFGTSLRFIEENVPLPLTVRGGVSYARSIDKPISPLTITPSLDGIKELDGDEKVNFGVEATALDLISLRAGYKYNLNSPQRGITAGAGFFHQFRSYQVNVDYAAGDYGNLGLTHRLSLRVGFKGSR
jgi:hypothetical protein